MVNFNQCYNSFHQHVQRLQFAMKKINYIGEIRHHATRHLETFSLHVHRNGYLGTSGKNLTLPFAPHANNDILL